MSNKISKETIDYMNSGKRFSIDEILDRVSKPISMDDIFPEDSILGGMQKIKKLSDKIREAK